MGVRLLQDHCFSEKGLCMPQNLPILHPIDMTEINSLSAIWPKIIIINLKQTIPIGIIAASEPPQSIMSCMVSKIPAIRAVHKILEHWHQKILQFYESTRKKGNANQIKKQERKEITYSFSSDDMVCCTQYAEVACSTSSWNRIVWAHPTLQFGM